MDDTLLKTNAVASMWGVSERQTRNIMSALEQLGFKLEVDFHGARMLPLAVAAATKAVRQAGLELASLRDREDMTRFLRPDAAPADDAFTDLLELRTEVSIVREVLGELTRSLSGGSRRYGYTAPTSWAFLGLPDPRRGL